MNRGNPLSRCWDQPNRRRSVTDHATWTQPRLLGLGNDADNLALAREADKLGYSVVWAAEAYGSDTATVLSWIAAQTEQIDIGSAVFQIPARTPAMTAMTAATLDTLSGGRFRLGLGVSGPKFRRAGTGCVLRNPLLARGSTSRSSNWRCHGRRSSMTANSSHPCRTAGQSADLTVHPVREEIPFYLAAIGPKNL